jgi:biotin-dependent carboxylase-like uncharacterized protein
MQGLEVIDAGLSTTIQDPGRVGLRYAGVPASGPLDHISFRLANAVVGNHSSTPALEMLMTGPTLRVLAESVRVALVGSNTSIEVGQESVGRIPPGRSVTLSRGEVFRVPALDDSVCAYLAIEGGFQVPPVLGSASTNVRGSFGGFHGRRLRQGDLLPLKLDSVQSRAEYAISRPFDLALDQPIRVILGPQAEYFTEDAIATFLSSEYTVSFQSDRMGYRLDGPVLKHAKGYNIVSDGIVTGSIQVPGSGQPIVLMVDNPTTGGYPKIATVISADVPLIGRRRPGRKIHFAAVEIDQAQLARTHQVAALQRLVQSMISCPISNL